ncbi:serine/threonine protein kinase with WD40 repeats [Candidatus Vecturithrix granuli]|uniref:Serine/threonine protein kinase with WD40 repeats n=1 Tax=Vecturithrix granuli TaxID=1499967 RepID=A0A081BXG8_VECG1|nr:serine/threonine protein kinase with WD40 repeats [Candidatus Vecturithrix granuli]
MSEQEQKNFSKKTKSSSSPDEPEEFDENFFMFTQMFRNKAKSQLDVAPSADQAKEYAHEQEFSWPAQQPVTEEFEQFEENYSTLSQAYKIQVRERPAHFEHPFPDKPKHDRISVEKAEWEIGDIIDGRYEILKVLGQGGMGVVYQVYHREWDLYLAVKMPLRRFVADDGLKARFLHEAQTWVDLGLHPNIVQCWYVRELGGIPRVFMDYLEGGSLKDWMLTGKVRPGEWEKILDFVIQACDGLGYAHEHGIKAHRDVKPGNLLLTPSGELRVTDFGIAKRAGNFMPEDNRVIMSSEGKQATVTTTEAGLGTPEYAAPEQWTTAKHTDARADIYALGGIAFQLCCGRRPYDDGRQKIPPYALIGRHLFTPVTDPRQFNQHIPSLLAELIMTCLAKAPDQRPSSMSELREKLTWCYQKILGKPYAREIPQAAELRSSTLNNHAVSLLDLGKKQEALATLERALQFDAHHPESVYNKALLEWRDESIADDEVVRRLKEAKQASWRAGLYLGFVHLERASADEAEKELIEALQIDELARDNAAWRALGDALMAQERFTEAENAYANALKLVPGDGLTWQRQKLAQQKTRYQQEQIIFPWPHCLHTYVGYPERPEMMMLTSDGQFALLGKGEELKLWDLETGRFFWTFEWSEKLKLWTFKGYAGSNTSLAMTSDARFAVSGGSYDPNVFVWDVETGDCLRILRGHTKEIRALALTSDGRYAVSGSADNTVRIWELATGKCVQMFQGVEKDINAVSITPDDQGILIGGGKFLWLLDVKFGKYQRRYRGHKDGITAVVTAPVGDAVISASSDTTLRLWKLLSGKCLHVFTGHSKGVTSLALTPDEKTVVSGSLDKTLRVWDLSSGKCRHILEGHKSAITAVTVSPDGRLVVSVGRDKTLRLWSLHTGKCLKVFKEYTYWLEAIAMTPDGRFALVGNHSEMRLKDLGKGNYLRRFVREKMSTPLTEEEPEQSPIRFWPLPPGECFVTIKGRGDTQTAVSVTQNGRFALAGSHEETLCLWDLLTERSLEIFRGERGFQIFKKHRNQMNIIAMTFDERVAVSGWSDASFRVWDLQSGKCLQILEGHAKRVTAVAVTPDGRLAISGSLDMTLRLWDLQTGKSLRIFEGHDGPVTAVAMTPDGRFGISGSTDKTLRLWDLQTGKCLRTFEEHEETVTAVAMTPDGQFALSGSTDKVLRLWGLDAKLQRPKAAFQVCRQREHWELETFKKRFRKYLEHAESAIKTRKPATAYTFLSLARSIPGYERDPAILNFNARLSKILQRKNLREGRLVRIIKGHEGVITSVAISMDGRFVLSGSRDDTLRLWPLMTGKCLRILKGHTANVVCVAMTSDRHFAVSGSWDNTLRLWALTTGESLKTFKGHDDYVRCVAVTPEGRFALSGSNDKTLRLWSLATEKYLEIFQGLRIPLEDAYKSAELTTDKNLRIFREHEGEVDAVAISPDGRFAVSGSWDTTLRVWDIATGKCLRVLKGHQDYVTAVAITPNGRFALSGSRDKTLRLWNLSAGHCVSILQGHTDYISSVAITSDGRFAVSGSWDKTARLWKLETGVCLRVFERHQESVETVAITLDGHFLVSGSRDKTLQIWELDWELGPR